MVQFTNLDFGMPSFARGSATPTYWGLIHRWLLLNGVIRRLSSISHHRPRKRPIRTYETFEEFARSTEENRSNFGKVPVSAKTLVRINRALGSPWRIPLAARAAVLGIIEVGPRSPRNME